MKEKIQKLNQYELRTIPHWLLYVIRATWDAFLQFLNNNFVVVTKIESLAIKNFWFHTE